jgi:lysozyme
MEHVNGLDVSDYQGRPSWPAVKASGYSFAFAKATQSTGNVQDTIATDLAGIRAAGMIAGAYHFFSFDTDPVQQAQHFLSIYEPRSGDLPPMLDLEYPDPNVAKLSCGPDDAVARIAAFLRTVEGKTKHRCLLYMGYYFWQDALGRTDGFSGHPLWLAQYSAGTTPLVPGAWKSATIWQYSESGAIGGISCGVDLDRFLGSLDELRALTMTGV